MVNENAATDNVVYSQFKTNTGEHRILYTSNVMIWAHNAELYQGYKLITSLQTIISGLRYYW